MLILLRIWACSSHCAQIWFSVQPQATFHPSSFSIVQSSNPPRQVGSVASSTSLSLLYRVQSHLAGRWPFINIHFPGGKSSDLHAWMLIHYHESIRWLLPYRTAIFNKGFPECISPDFHCWPRETIYSVRGSWRLPSSLRIPFGVTNGISRLQCTNDEILEVECIKDNFTYISNVAVRGITRTETFSDFLKSPQNMVLHSTPTKSWQMLMK